MDRLSGLPDDVVCHILSFLPTKISVRTSTLSKGWRFHWARVPCSTAKTAGGLVTTFHIGSGTKFDSWIATVFARDVVDLVIGLNHPLFALPRCLFACESLVYLRIHDCGGIPKDGHVSFPALKKLELVDVGYDSHKSLPCLLSGCPVLQELTIERVKNVLYCDVSSPSLTRLVLDADDAGMLHLRTPSLRCLRIRDRTCDSTIVARPMTSLIEADVDLVNAGGTKFADLDDLTNAADAYVRMSYSCYVIKFVEELCTVECLKLSTCPMGPGNISCPDSVVKFRNLTQLSLSTDWRFITSFLENANNLRVLKILRMVDHITQRWMEPKQVPECLASHLETVSLVDFGWSVVHEFDMVKYILKNGKVLKKVEIICTKHYKLDSNVKREAIKRISMFEMSPTCQLTFVSFI